MYVYVHVYIYIDIFTCVVYPIGRYVVLSRPVLILELAWIFSKRIFCYIIDKDILQCCINIQTRVTVIVNVIWNMVPKQRHPLSSCILMARTVRANLIAGSKPISRDRARTPSWYVRPPKIYHLCLIYISLLNTFLVPYPTYLSRYSAEVRLYIRICLKKNLQTWI